MSKASAIILLIISNLFFSIQVQSSDRPQKPTGSSGIWASIKSCFTCCCCCGRKATESDVASQDHIEEHAEHENPQILCFEDLNDEEKHAIISKLPAKAIRQICLRIHSPTFKFSQDVFSLLQANGILSLDNNLHPEFTEMYRKTVSYDSSCVGLSRFGSLGENFFFRQATPFHRFYLLQAIYDLRTRYEEAADTALQTQTTACISRDVLQAYNLLGIPEETLIAVLRHFTCVLVIPDLAVRERMYSPLEDHFKISPTWETSSEGNNQFSSEENEARNEPAPNPFATPLNR